MIYNTLSKFYTGREWARFRESLMFDRLAVDGVLYCQHCSGAITKKYDCIAHHVTELTTENVNDVSVSLNPENVLLVHHRCHNIIHERFGGQTARKVYLVYGAPFAGKRKFVTDNAAAGDLILDVDAIWQSLTGQPSHVKPDRLKRNVFAVRDTIMDQIKTRFGLWRNAWVIMGAPLIMERQRLQQKLGCELIHIDTPQAECYQRLAAACEGSAINHGEYKKYIDTWFEKYQEEQPYE